MWNACKYKLISWKYRERKYLEKNANDLRNLFLGTDI